METKKLKKLQACEEAVEWASQQKSFPSAWEACERGDWMLWLAYKLRIDDRKLTMAKYHCAAQVLHLMKDKRSIDAMAAALKYANDEIDRNELDVYASAAYAVIRSGLIEHAASAAASYAASAASAASYAAIYASASSAASSTASLKASADICREYLTEEVLLSYENYK